MELTRENIVNLLRTNDKAIARALLVLNSRQTDTEQAIEAVNTRNARGFRPCHARMGTSMAKFYERTGYLTAKQIAYWRNPGKQGMRIEIYAMQLIDEAKIKKVA